MRHIVVFYMSCILIIFQAFVTYSQTQYLLLDKNHPSFVEFRNQTGIQSPVPLAVCETTREATDATTFNTAVTASNPGDCIEFPSGNYDLGTVTIASGRDRITIKPASGVVGFTGATKFQVNASGINFHNLAFSMVTTRGIEIHKDTTGTKIRWCDFTGYGDHQNDSAIFVHGDNVEIAYNLFTNTVGFAFSLVGAGDLTYEANDAHIHHNEFTNYGGALGDNGSIGHVGLGGITLWGPGFSNRMIFEYNYIEAWDGDPELVSVKSSDNIIRYNYIVNSHGSQHLNVRVGRNNLFYGNYVEYAATLGNAYGWRVSGSGNVFAYNMAVADNVSGISTVYFEGAGTSPTAELVASDNIIQHNVFQSFETNTTLTNNSLTPTTVIPSGNQAIKNFHLGNTVVDVSSSYTSSTVTWEQWSSNNELNNFALPFDVTEQAYGPTILDYEKYINALGTTIYIPRWFEAIGFDVRVNTGFTTK